MIDLNKIYQGRMTPEKRLYAMFNLMDGTIDLYKLPTNCIQSDWTMAFSKTAERKSTSYSSPYQISYRPDRSGGLSATDTDSRHIRRIEEDINNIEFVISAVMSFNTVSSKESRELLIRKFFLKENNAEISEVMYNLSPNRTLDRKIRSAKQDAIEAFGLDLFDENGQLRNISLVRKERVLLRQKIKIS